MLGTDGWRISVTTASGGMTLNVDVEEGATVDGLTSKIGSMLNVQPDGLHLAREGVGLDRGDRSLADYGVANGDELQLRLQEESSPDTSAEATPISPADEDDGADVPVSDVSIISEPGVAGGGEDYPDIPRTR